MRFKYADASFPSMNPSLPAPLVRFEKWGPSARRRLRQRRTVEPLKLLVDEEQRGRRGKALVVVRVVDEVLTTYVEKAREPAKTRCELPVFFSIRSTC